MRTQAMRAAWRSALTRMGRPNAGRSVACGALSQGPAVRAVVHQACNGSQGARRGNWLAATAAVAAFVGSGTVSAEEAERTFIAIKPDGVQRGLIADIIARFERKGYKLVAVKILVPTKEFAGKHYAEHEGRPFFEGLTDFLSSGPVLAMVWEGQGVVTYGRKMIGATKPLESAPGTIRGDFGIQVGRNIIHGSDSPDSAKKEIGLWFTPEDLVSYGLDIHKWVYEK